MVGSANGNDGIVGFERDPSFAAIRRLEPSTLAIVDMHTAGEPVRIVTAGYPVLVGADILAKRRDAQTNHDALRRQMMLEPRGHGGMYGVIPLTPDHPDAALGVLFIHAGGYSTMCGHATIAIVRWAIDSGRVPPCEPETRFTLQCPCGPVAAFARVEAGQVIRSGFESVPAFIEASDVSVATPQFGAVTVDIVYGGAYYALARASAMGLDFDRDSTPTLAAAAAHLFHEARALVTISRPDAADLAFLYGVILTDDANHPEPTRNLCVFGDGQIDRSPTGSGVTARLAHDALKNGIALGETRTFIGPTGEAFTGAAVRRDDFEGRPAIIARIEGQSFYSAVSTLIVETDDPLGNGFLLTGETPALS